MMVPVLCSLITDYQSLLAGYQLIVFILWMGLPIPISARQG